MKEIPVYRGFTRNAMETSIRQVATALVDDEDYDKAIQKKWRAQSRKDGSIYPVTAVNNRPFFMHYMIFDRVKGLTIDHIDGNPLNNQKSNLRFCTLADNMCNRSLYKNSKTGYKGVVKAPRGRKDYFAQIRFRGELIPLGVYDTPEEAALKYNEAAIKYHGEFARLNNVLLRTNTHLMLGKSPTHSIHDNQPALV